MGKLGSSILAALVAVLVASPSFAGKAALNEEELDRITAAGQPTVIMLETVSASSDVLVTLQNGDTDVLTLASSSQDGIRALVLNNVLGENQTATGINISSSNGGTAGAQLNDIMQSWGSIKITGVTTATLAVSVAGVSGGDAIISGNNNNTNTQTPSQTNSKCPLCSNNQSSGDQTVGDATAGDAVEGNLAGIVVAIPEFISADQIVTLSNVSSASGGVVVVVDNAATRILDLSTDSQSGLVALVVNNIVGQNQTATGVNISNGGSLAVGGGVPQVTLNASSAKTSGAQTNTIAQYRGTPANAPLGVAAAVVTGQAPAIAIGGALNGITIP